MIILPDRHIHRLKLFEPFPKQEGVTRYRVRARLHDGFVRWAGWFDDQADADAFLFAAVSDTLRYQPALWRLPSPNWHPDIGEGVFYEFSTTTTVTTTTTGTSQSGNFTVSTVGAYACDIEAWGSGSGGNDQAGSLCGCGGAYAGSFNLTLSTGQTIYWFISSGGKSKTSAGVGNDGNASFSRVGTNAAPTSSTQGAYADYGRGGATPAVGLASNCIGQIAHSGGLGYSGPGKGGGGGSAGSQGDGGAGSATAGGAAGTPDGAIGGFGTTVALAIGNKPGSGGGCIAAGGGAAGGDGQIRYTIYIGAPRLLSMPMLGM